MIKQLNKFFMSEYMLYSMPWIYILSVFSCDALAFVSVENMQLVEAESSFSYTLFVMDLAIALCVGGLALSYYGHKKNRVKTFMGATFMMRMIYALTKYTTYELFFDDTTSIIWAVANFIISMAFLIDHLVLNCGHSSKVGAVRVSQLLFALNIAIDIFMLITSFGDAFGVFVCIFTIISDFASLSVIVGINARLDAFRAARVNK